MCETESSIIFRGEGGFGGQPPPKREVVDFGKEPSWEVTLETSPEQALLYRLSGDQNPLHADPEFAKMVGFPAPILHGLCSYGFVARAVVKQCCGGDGDKLKFFSAQFVSRSGQVRPFGFRASTLETVKSPSRRMRLTGRIPVLSKAWVELED